MSIEIRSVCNKVELSAVNELFAKHLGKGVAEFADLIELYEAHDGAVFMVTNDDILVAGASCRVLHDVDPYDFLGFTYLWLNSEKVGFLASSVVIPEFQGMGIGTELVKKRLEFLVDEMGCEEIYATSWESGYHYTSRHVLENLGFKRVFTKPYYWWDSGENVCSKCKGKCTCSASLMKLRVDGG